MCDKCIKRAIGKEILDVQFKLDRIFAKAEKDITFRSNVEFVRLIERMRDFLDKYPKE
jgi:hypothetical protein